MQQDTGERKGDLEFFVPNVPSNLTKTNFAIAL